MTTGQSGAKPPTGSTASRPPAPPRYIRPLRTGRQRELEQRREETRSWVALVLVALIATVALLLVVLTATGDLSIDDAKDLAGVVLAPLIAVTGTVFGFYYGGHR